MATSTVSTRLDPEEIALLESLLQISGFDRSTLVKMLLKKGMGDMRLELASDQYRKEKVTLSRAAEIAGISLWDFIARMKREGLEFHYDETDLEHDLDAFAKSG